MGEYMFRIMQMIWLNGFVYTASVLLTVLCVPVYGIFLTGFHLLFGFTKAKKKLRRLITCYGYVIVKYLVFPFVRIQYTDYDLPNRGVPSVYVSNHRSFSDGFLLSMLPIEGIQVVKGWPFKIPVLGSVARLAGYLNVDALSAEEFIANGKALLAVGSSVAGFPEGTRSGTKEMGQFNGILFRLALEAKCPIVPVCIVGNENIPPRGSLVMRPGTIKMCAMKGIEWEEYKDIPPFQLKNMARDIIAKKIIEMENTHD